jgi:hypothetical protein
MSHVTDVKLKIRDLDALKAAAEECGLELREDQKTFAWWGNFVGDSNQYGEMTPDKMGKCDHALRIPGTNPRNGSAGPWEIGVFKSADGDGYGLAFDTYGGAGRQLLDKVGPNADKLRQAYAVNVAEAKALKDLSRHGWRATREKLPTGQVRIKLRKR